MAYFKPYINEKGIHVPTYTDIFGQMEQVYKETMGVDEKGEGIYFGPESPDYQMLSVLSVICDDLCALVVDEYNSRNPDYAIGVALDNLCALNGIRRRMATYSTATLEVTGFADILVEPGQMVEDEKGMKWRINEGWTFDKTGKATVSATAVEPGAVRAGIGEINYIITHAYGWESVHNTDVKVGLNRESDIELRQRRQGAIAMPSASTFDGLRAALESTVDVQKVALYENKTDVTDERGIPSHSLMAIVKGGNSGEIAKAIALKKGQGVGTHGDQMEKTLSAYGEEVNIKFQRPKEKKLLVDLQIQKIQGWSQEMEEVITGAILNYADSRPIGDGLDVSYLMSVIYGALLQSAGNEGNKALGLSITGLVVKDELGRAVSAGIFDIAFDENVAVLKESIVITYLG